MFLIPTLVYSLLENLKKKKKKMKKRDFIKFTKKKGSITIRRLIIFPKHKNCFPSGVKSGSELA
jgi:hypothetical protein